MIVQDFIALIFVISAPFVLWYILFFYFPRMFREWGRRRLWNIRDGIFNDGLHGRVPRRKAMEIINRCESIIGFSEHIGIGQFALIALFAKDVDQPDQMDPEEKEDAKTRRLLDRANRDIGVSIMLIMIPGSALGFAASILISPVIAVAFTISVITRAIRRYREQRADGPRRILVFQKTSFDCKHGNKDKRWRLEDEHHIDKPFAAVDLFPFIPMDNLDNMERRVVQYKEREMALSSGDKSRIVI